MPAPSTLLSLIQRELPPSSERPLPTRICCRAASDCAVAGEQSMDAWFFGAAANATVGKNALSRDTTIYVSSSARPRDDGDANLRMLVDSLRSVRRELHLADAAAVLIFDGLGGKPSVSPGIARRYASKIARALATLPEAHALVAETWLHQANSLRCAMALQTPARTPLVFVIQDDTQVGPGGVKTQLLHRALMRDPLVEYVRFAIHSDCKDARGRIYQGYTPCTPHPTASALQRTDRWLDRPHFARRAHYETRLFATLPYGARVTPEQVLDQQSRISKGHPHAEWPLWMYGARGDMARDLHWPTLVDGRYYVSKEFVRDLKAKGHNVSYSYAHSYLIHAYRGKTQDVGAEQISQLAFRKHNPNAWHDEDGLTAADERR